MDIAGIAKSHHTQSTAIGRMRRRMSIWGIFDYQQLNEDSVLPIPGLEIYRSRKEISLTVKEYGLL